LREANGFRAFAARGRITCDELTVADLFSLSITTVVQSAYEIGFRAAGRLMGRIDRAKTESAISNRLPARLEVRASSQPPCGAVYRDKETVLPWKLRTFSRCLLMI
jgi:DNA-binding LacI/PurR family transcriptional regulator